MLTDGYGFLLPAVIIGQRVELLQPTRFRTENNLEENIIYKWRGDFVMRLKKYVWVVVSCSLFFSLGCGAPPEEESVVRSLKEIMEEINVTKVTIGMTGFTGESYDISLDTKSGRFFGDWVVPHYENESYCIESKEIDPSVVLSPSWMDRLDVALSKIEVRALSTTACEASKAETEGVSVDGDFPRLFVGHLSYPKTCVYLMDELDFYAEVLAAFDAVEPEVEWEKRMDSGYEAVSESDCLEE